MNMAATYACIDDSWTVYYDRNGVEGVQSCVKVFRFSSYHDRDNWQSANQSCAALSMSTGRDVQLLTSSQRTGYVFDWNTQSVVQDATNLFAVTAVLCRGADYHWNIMGCWLGGYRTVDPVTPWQWVVSLARSMSPLCACSVFLCHATGTVGLHFARSTSI